MILHLTLLSFLLLQPDAKLQNAANGRLPSTRSSLSKKYQGTRFG